MNRPAGETLPGARRALGAGIAWLGASGFVAQAVDAASALAVLSLLSAGELGVATLAWSVAVMLEAFNGFGIATALVQARRLSRGQLDGAWWYATGLGLLLALLAALAAPGIALAWDAPAVQAMVVASALKLPLVGAALVPLQLLGRELRFRELAAVQASATLVAALVRVALAAAGLGAWALIAAHVAHGLVTLATALLLHPFRPGLRPALRETRPLLAFGAVAASSSALYHVYRNADYLIVGRLLGMEALGLYRVAFELAMTPAMAVASVANRAAFPVLARLQAEPAAQRALFLDTQRALALLLVALAAFFTAGAGDLLKVVGGGHWQEATAALVVLAWAAVLRGIDQVFPQLFHASGRPGLALADALVAGLVLCGSFWLAADRLGATLGGLSVALAWLAAYPVLIVVLLGLSRHAVPVAADELLRALAPAAALAPLALAAGAGAALVGRTAGPLVAVLAAAVAVAATAAVFMRRCLGASPLPLLRPIPEAPR